jgi:DNA repair protein RecO (recombination protein O)
MPDIWPALFVRFEIGLLAMLGYGLDFSACAIRIPSEVN